MWSHIHTCDSMPVTTTTPLRGSCSIETLVSYLAYLLGLDHSRTRDPHARTVIVLKQINEYSTNICKSYHIIICKGEGKERYVNIYL